MNKKILLGCYEIPGYGGASTRNYALFEMMQRQGFDVHCLNIIDEQDENYFKYMYGENYGNPKHLHNVHNCVLRNSLFAPHPELEDFIRNIGPDIMVGVGYIASFVMKKADPTKNLLFFASGSYQVVQSIARKKVKDAINLEKLVKHTRDDRIEIFNTRDKKAADASDLIIANSDMGKIFYQKFFPSCIEKIYENTIWAAEWIYKSAKEYSRFKKDFDSRDIDILFISSIWSRPEKNYKLVKKIASRCKDLKIHIVGEVERKLSCANYHGLITKREELFSLLGRTKTIVCPSLWDSAPGILFEASAMDCNIIASKNCGNWKICNETLLVDPFSLNNFIKKIYFSLAKKYKDNVDYFIKANSYKDLLDTILLF